MHRNSKKISCVLFLNQKYTKHSLANSDLINQLMFPRWENKNIKTQTKIDNKKLVYRSPTPAPKKKKP